MKRITITIAIFSLFSFISCFASGNAGTSTGKSVKQEVYKLGQSIIAGEVDLTKETQALSVRRGQESTLKRLQKKVAKKSAANAKKIDVKKLAGHLTSKQLRAVTYYIDVRFLNPSKYTK